MKTIKMMALPFTFLAAATLLGGCADTESPPEDDAALAAPGESEVPEPEQACEDVADAIATSGARCGFDYQATHDAFVRAVGGCTNIVSVRDKTSLYDDCIPTLRSLTCDEGNDPNLQLPESCEGQLLR